MGLFREWGGLSAVFSVRRAFCWFRRRRAPHKLPPIVDGADRSLYQQRWSQPGSLCW